MAKIYLAGPDVFLRDVLDIKRRKEELCAAHGHEGVFPFDPETDEAEAIFHNNVAKMDACDVGLFNLTPFRGPSADAGTVFELGYMSAVPGKRVFGYSSANAGYAERVGELFGPVEDNRDRDGFGVEPFGLRDNLMIEFAAGGITVVDEDGLAAMLAFTECLKKV